jgi:hypothetical protein
MIKKILLTSFILSALFTQAKKNSIWFNTLNNTKLKSQDRFISNKIEQLYWIDYAKLEAQLFNFSNNNNSIEIILPISNNQTAEFILFKSNTIHPDLAIKYGYATYRGYQKSNKSNTIVADYTTYGFRAKYQVNDDVFYLDPALKTDKNISTLYKKSEYENAKSFVCEVDNAKTEIKNYSKSNRSGAIEVIKKTYRIAVAATGEYTTFHGGTIQGALSAIITTINRVNEVYLNDIGVEFQLVANNDSIIFTNASTDPYNGSNANNMITTNTGVINQAIGSANYDIGHVFSTGGAGLAYLASTCNNSNKGGGVTGIANPVGDPFDIDYVAHEIGHQMNANHSFNACGGNGSSFAPAFEPGSGVTIMGYAGLCGSGFNIAQNSIAAFHAGNLDEMNDYVSSGRGRNCGINTPTGNNTPTLKNSLPQGKTIPISTPFELMATASDVDADIVTYSWEQIDAGPVSNPATPSGNAPLFRSFMPTTDSIRIFPRLAGILTGNNSSSFERLPTTQRNMRFRLTVRDNNILASGSENLNFQVAVTAEAGPFKVLTANESGHEMIANFQNLVEWDPANTQNAPVSADFVDIYLSTNGGQDFTPLLMNTPNDGNELVVLPSFSTQQNDCRIKIKASNSIFFDINDRNFRIIPSSVGVSENVQTTLFKVFPNPNNGQFTLQLNNREIKENTSIKIFDLKGKLVHNEVKSIKNTVILHAEHLVKGIYFLQINSGNDIQIEKLNILK